MQGLGTRLATNVHVSRCDDGHDFHPYAIECNNEIHWADVQEWLILQVIGQPTCNNMNLIRPLRIKCLTHQQESSGIQ